MPINLSKGQKVSLTKGNPRLKKIMVGLGWDVNVFHSGADFDLDASVFMVGSNGKCPTDKEFIFYGNLEHSSGAVKSMGDNLTGIGDEVHISIVLHTVECQTVAIWQCLDVDHWQLPLQYRLGFYRLFSLWCHSCIVLEW